MQKSGKYRKIQIASKTGYKPDPLDAKAIEEMKEPKNVKGVSKFLGISGFYRKDVPNFACTVRPLTKLKQDNKFDHFIAIY